MSVAAGFGALSVTSSSRPTDLRFQLGGRPLGDRPPVIDDHDPVLRKLVGLVEVLGGQEDSCAIGHELADHLPHLGAAERVEPRSRLVQEQHRGPGNERHVAENETIEAAVRELLRNPEAPLDQRVRMACSIGAVLTGLIHAGSYFTDVPADELTDHVRAVIADMFRSGDG